MPEYIIETLVDGQPSTTEQTDDGFDLDVLIGSVYSEGTVSDLGVIEVYAYVPEQDTKIEAIQFSHGGTLVPKVGTTKYPVAGGVFSFESIAAMVGTAPSGSSVVLDIKKNGSTIFPLPADRPTIIDGGTAATVGSWSNVTVTTGDYLSVDIVAVGSTTPGEDLVLSVRMKKIG